MDKPSSVDVGLHTFKSPEFTGVLEEAIAFFCSTPVHSLPPPEAFPGVGVYALYYKGDFSEYSAISGLNSTGAALPIYVGKAVPSGWRAARQASSDEDGSVHGRLREHARSIEQANNLQASHFTCRFVLLFGAETDLLTSVEASLIRKHNPLWNSVIDGFGNHDPGSGRYDQAVSEWDTVHPGRSWVTRLKGPKPSLDSVLLEIRRYKPTGV